VLAEYFVPAALGLMMAALGMSLTVTDFRKLALQPRAVITGVFCQVVLLPLLGLGLIKLLQVPNLAAMNVMILVCCAGGVVSALFTRLANGDVALSVSMTIITLITAVVTIPIIINTSLASFLSQDSVQLSLFSTSIGLIAFTVLPVSMGMICRANYPGLTLKFEPYIAKAGTFLLLATIVTTLVLDFSKLYDAAKDLFVILFCLNLTAMAVGYSMAKFLRLSITHRKTLTIEVGIQNSATGVFIATTLLNNIDLAVGSYVYTAISFINLALLILIWRFSTPSRETLSYEQQ